MTYAYEARFDYQEEDEGWLATIPAFEGAVAFGKTIPEACSSIATVLQLFIVQWLDDGRSLPKPSFHEPPFSVISVDVDDAYRVRTRCMTITEAATELGVSIGRVSQLVTSGILAAIELDGRRYVTIESIERRKRNHRGAGRPKKAVAAV